ncbi:MAG: hypothetical protein U0401_07705 [Anaerolineae bacterium]
MVDAGGLDFGGFDHKASIQERDGAKSLLQRAKAKGFHYLYRIWPMAAMVVNP